MATKKKDGGSEKGVKECPVGTVLFREGESGDRMYVIKSGRVRIFKRVFDTEVAVEELGPGEFCGELALVNKQPRAVSAIVVREATVIQIEAAQFETMLKGNSDIALRMLKKMGQRLTQAHYRMTNLMLRTARGRLVHQLYHEVTSSSKFAEVGFSQPRPVPDNLPDVLGLEIGEIKTLLNELVRDEIISLDRQGYFQIVDEQAYKRYLRYHELRDRFEYRQGPAR